MSNNRQQLTRQQQHTPPSYLSSRNMLKHILNRQSDLTVA